MSSAEIRGVRRGKLHLAARRIDIGGRGEKMSGVPYWRRIAWLWRHPVLSLAWLAHPCVSRLSVSIVRREREEMKYHLQWLSIFSTAKISFCRILF